MTVLLSGRLRWSGHVQRTTSIIKSVANFAIPDNRSRGRPERHDLNVRRMISVNVACLALTHKADTRGELVLDASWCCQPHRLGHGQHLNHKMDMMMNGDDYA